MTSVPGMWGSYRPKVRPPTLQERLAQRKDRVRQTREKQQGSLLERLRTARQDLAKRDPERYKEVENNLHTGTSDVMPDTAKVEVINETENRPRSRTSSTSSNRSNGKNTSSTSHILTTQDAPSTSSTQASSTSSSRPDTSGASPSQVRPKVIPVTSSTASSSSSRGSSRGMPAEEFNRKLAEKRAAVVRDMVASTHARQGEEYDRREEEKAEERREREERARRKEERLRTQALRGQVRDEFTRIRYTLPYYAERAAHTDTQIIKMVLRIALRKPQARFRLGQLVAHYKKLQEESEGTEEQFSDSDKRFVQDLERLIRDVTRHELHNRPEPRDKFPKPDVYSVKPLPTEPTGSEDDVTISRKQSQDYVRALEKVVDNDLAKVIAEENGGVKKDNAGHKNLDTAKRKSLSRPSGSRDTVEEIQL